MAQKEEISHSPVELEQHTNNTENIFKICHLEILG